MEEEALYTKAAIPRTAPFEVRAAEKAQRVLPNLKAGVSMTFFKAVQMKEVFDRALTEKTKADLKAGRITLEDLKK